MNSRIFREYDIRGVADRDITDDLVSDLGEALAAQYIEHGCKRVTLGRDARVSSPRIHAILRERLLEAGLDVQDVGIVHTPGLYFSVFHLEADGGVMITASHNPGEDNGFKIVRGKTTIFGDEIQDLLRRIQAKRAGKNGAGKNGASKTKPGARKRGTATEIDIITPYVDYIAGNLRLGWRRPKVVLDSGNGTGGVAALPLLARLGFPTDSIFHTPDGRFPHHHPDPTVPKNVEALAARMKATGAEVGIALDGDADRIGVVDAHGRIVWGDQLVMIFGREILKERPGATFVSEVKCSQALYDELAKAGGRPIMWKVGHSLIKKKMKEEHAVLAGEMSGHMFFADRYFGFDDAVYAAARLCELLSRGERTLADIVDTLPVLYNTPELRLDCPDDLKFQVVARAAAYFKERYPVVDIDGARVQFPGGWGLVRASNTGPVLVMRCEANTPERLAEIRQELEGRIASITKELARGGKASAKAPASKPGKVSSAAR